MAFLKPLGLALQHAAATPGRAIETAWVGAAITANATSELFDWVVNINRVMIRRFVEKRFPKEFAELDGGDLRIMTQFLEPEFVSNTASLLVGGGSFKTTSEYRLGARGTAAFVVDALGPLADADNTFVVSPRSDADQGAERWFFINGIATSRELAARNAGELKCLFGHEITTIHNPTGGLVADLVESALQKFTNVNTEPVARAFLEIGKALLRPDVGKVVLVAHSQGTIISGDVLDLIYCSLDPKFFDRTNMNKEDFEVYMTVSHGDLSSNLLVEMRDKLAGKAELVADKLELYMFANAASRMCYLDPILYKPHIESYVNEHDIVTRLGSLACDTFHRENLIRIDGPVFSCDRYGHLLNAHYLPGFVGKKYKLLETRDSSQAFVRDSIHLAVSGNPCELNPARVAGPRLSRLSTYLRERPRDSTKASGPPTA